jgi:ABC-type lipoprotein release transport system permease subunit
MRALRLCATAALRHRWLGMVAIALLVGLGAGAVLAAAAGARRTDSAASRLYARGKVADLQMDATSQSIVPTEAAIEQIRGFPEVRQATAATFFALATVHAGTPPQIDAFAAGDADGTWLYDFDRIGKMPSFRGRMPNPARADEVVPTIHEAQVMHWHLGQRIPVRIAKFTDPDATAPSSYSPSITLHVVGITPTPVGLLQGGDRTETLIFATPAFARRFEPYNVGSTTYVVLKHHDDLQAFEQRVTTRSSATTYEIKSSDQELSTFARVASPYTNTLWIFAVVAAAAALLIISQALVRVVRADASVGPELRALGVTAAGRALIASARAAFAVCIGLLLAVALAIAASPLFPLGLVHRVKPDPGVRIDGAALGLGALAMGAGLLVVVFWTARHATRAAISSEERTGRASRVATWLGTMNAPVSIVSGTRLAFRRTAGTTGASTGTSIFGLVAAIAATAAALVFGANLSQIDTPAHYGQTWDAEIVSGNTGPISPASVPSILRRHSLTRAVSVGTFGDVKVAGRIIPSYGLTLRSGHAAPVATQGRLPRQPDEIAFGVRTLRQLGRSVGDTIVATGSGGKRHRLRIVGETLLASLNANTPAVGADDGAMLTTPGLARLNPDLRGETDFVLVDLAPGATVRELQRTVGKDFTVTGKIEPAYIASYNDVTATPLVLAGLLALLGIGALAHLLVTSVRANRRDLAVLKSLGCTRRQLSVMVFWQALLVVIIASTLGLLIGIGLGRVAWRRFADGIDLAPSIPVLLPALALAAIVAVAAVSAVLIAWHPARAATRVQASRVLRTE